MKNKVISDKGIYLVILVTVIIYTIFPYETLIDDDIFDMLFLLIYVSIIVLISFIVVFISYKLFVIIKNKFIK